jgi:type I restriction enzyme S subunit
MKPDDPQNWQPRELGAVVTLQRGRDLPVQLRKPGPYPVIGSNGIVGYHSQCAAKGPGVLVGRSGSVGTVTWVESDYWPLNTTLWVSDFHRNNPKFASYFLEYLDLRRYTAGVSVPTLNRNVVHPLRVTIPPLPEQRAIARALRAVREAKESRQRELALERERKAALVEFLFTRGTCGEPRKQTGSRMIPESWEATGLGDVCLFEGGTQPPRATFVFVPTEGYVRLQQIRDFETDDYPAFVSKSYNLRLVEEGDVLLARYGASVGKVFRAKSGAINVALMRAMPDERRLSKSYLYFFLQTEHVQAYLKGLGGRSAQAGFNQGELRRIPLPLPSVAEQQVITNVLALCDQLISALERESAVLNELFATLLEELMTGRLSAVPLIEPEAGA